MYILTQTLAFQVAERDLPEKVEWNEAQKASQSIGDRWRLPTKEELSQMHRLHQRAIGGFKFEAYWSSEGFNNWNAFAMSFNSGQFFSSGPAKSPPLLHNVRLVRNI